MAKRTSWFVRMAIEPDEKKAIKDMAKAELRSASNMIVVLLREALANRAALSKILPRRTVQ